jgi:prolyl-tRNA synthetase
VIELELKQMHSDMLAKQKAKLDQSIVRVSSWDEVMPALNNKKMVLAPWCEDPESEEDIKKLTAQISKEQVKDESGEAPALSGAMKTLCIPFESSGYQEPMAPGTMCFFTGKPAKRWTLWGRSY